MGVIGIILLVLFIICSVLLIVVVMMQDDQGEGLGGIFGGGSTTPFGSKSGNVLTKFTGILGGLFMICSFGVALTSRSVESGDVLGAARRANQNSVEWWLDEADTVPAETEGILTDIETE